ncbi:MAG: hypothetical protein A2Y07_00160 [Planctomycetes bacterium GWF2_50_10]|nr:MAG: hypothetical protein A2Y07_00160 [Planctomycetes bacterium GWF2_50_10]
MQCPKCNKKKGIEIYMHSEGYKDLLECTACGTVWVHRWRRIEPAPALLPLPNSESRLQVLAAM